MDRVRAGRVYIARSVLDDPLAAARANRLAGAIDAPVKEVIADDEVERMQAPFARALLERRGFEATSFDARLIFIDRMRWDREDGVSPGYGPTDLRNAHREWEESGVICQTAVEIQTVVGCGFDCSYCPYTNALTITCDLERFVEHLEGIFQQRPHQQLYKLNNRSDTLCFEPEYGLSALLVDRFAQSANKVLMLYSKSANVDHLLELDHRGHTIACFTLSSPSAARLLERAAPPTGARIVAARKCSDAGYPVRFRFSPIVPLRGWQAELETMVRTMAAQVRPELITLWTLSMTELDELARIVPLDALDPRTLEEAEAARASMVSAKGAPFPGSLRAEIYEVVADTIAAHSPQTRVSLCLESPQVIERVSARLAIVGQHQVCNCAPRSTPSAVGSAPAVSDPSARGPVHGSD
ncbi:MAG: hypothetical protein IT384_34555 [Deltaproteobacteria bacterium]|nr:hypothetical protein [Deltaproteobacteria bacterium]